MNLKKTFPICALISVLSASNSHAVITLADGDLVVDISEINGAIDLYQWTDSNAVTADYFNLGAPVSDYGFQVGTDTATFSLANTSDSISGPLAVSSVISSGSTAVVTGQYTGGGATLDFTRIYSLTVGQDSLSVTTTLTNNGLASLSFTMFDTFDPDQGSGLGVGTGTYNDVYIQGSVTTAKAYVDSGGFNHTAILYAANSLNPTVAAGGPFRIDSGATLNDFISSPVDADGSFADMGIHIAFQPTLAAGESIDLHFDLATAETAETVVVVTAVPEPSASLLGVLGGALCFFNRRRK